MKNQSPTLVEILARWLTRLLEGFGRLTGLLIRLIISMVDLTLSFSSLVMVVIKRMWHNLGISLSAMLGVVAVLSIVVGVPIFSYSISSDVLVQELAEKSSISKRGLFSLHMYYIDDPKASPMTYSTVEAIETYLTEATSRLFDLKTEQILAEAETKVISWYPDQVSVNISPDEPWIHMRLTTEEGLQKKAEIVEGTWPDDSYGSDELIQVAVLESTAETYFINIGDRYNNGPLNIEVVGIWRPISLDVSKWYDKPKMAYADAFWVPSLVFTDVLPKYLERPIFYSFWYVTIDESEIRFDRAIQYAQGMIRMSGELKRMVPGLIIDYSPLEALEGYLERSQRLSNLFYAIGGPMVVLTLLFIGLTATIAVQQYEQETATMRGRGTSWWQVISLNLIESLVLIVIAVPISLGMGWLSAYLMSRTLSFLNFADQGTLPFTLQGININWILLASGFVILARFLPTLSISRSSIIQVKQEQSRSANKPIWQRLYLDFLLLLPGLYAYLTFSGLAEPTQAILEVYETVASDEPYRDPLLFVAPALFAMAVCLISLRVIPLIFRLASAIIDRLPSVWSYLAMQQITRRPQEHSSALLLIMMSLSLSIYSASSAKTLDKWMHDSIYYQYGADIVVHEYVIEGGDAGYGGSSSASTLSELDLNVAAYLSLEDHLKLPNVNGATRVAKYTGTYSYGVGEAPAVFMGIDRLDFPSTAFYREDFADQSLGGLMNALGGELNSVLVPRWLADEKGFQTGDRLFMSANVLDQTYESEMVITGFFDYYPTVYPSNQPTFIVNLDALFDNPDAVIGYDIWLDLKDESDTGLLLYQIREMMGSEGAVVDVPGNSLEAFQERMAEPERVGVFGVLNVGFIATGLMPGIGFVLYSFASLRRRFIQLGILQALGLSVAQLIGYLVLEQFMLMGLAIIFGASIGLLVSYMFLPFLQVGAGAGAMIPPFDILIGWAESSWLSIGFGIVLVVTTLGTIIYLTRIKVFQAVKMGETL